MRLVSSGLHHSADESADAIVASLLQRFVAFLVSPFAIVLAMRPQREREAARIAAEFRCDRSQSENVQ
jgi:hypothetical protein